MKPFDLEAAKRGEPVMTRCGQKAIFSSVAPDEKGLAFWICYVNIEWELKHYYMDGTRLSTGQIEPLDLFMAPKTVKYWRRHYRVIDRGLTIIKTQILSDSLYYSEQRKDDISTNWLTDWESFEINID